MSDDFATDWSRTVDSLLQPQDDPSWVALDLFAGCGGLALGFEAAGFQTLGFEMDRDAAATYNKNLAGDCYEEFLTEDTELPHADIVIGGPPCQPFSVGGSQRGRHDDRDGFPAFIAAVARVQPEVFLFENVRGMLYRNRQYYASVLRSLAQLGYTIEEQLLNAVDFGVPQNRQRVVVVGHRSAFTFPDGLTRRVTVDEALGGFLSYAPPSANYLTPAQDTYIARYEEKSKCVKPRDLHSDRPARTLTCRNLGGATSDMHRILLPDGRRRRLLMREAARLQSFPDWFEFYGGVGSQFDQIGNAVAPLFALHLARAVRAGLEAAEIETPESALNEREALVLFHTEPEWKTQPEGGDVGTVAEMIARLKTLKSFAGKTEQEQELILEALDLLVDLGLPMGDLVTSPRRAEKMGLALLTMARVAPGTAWSRAQDSDTSSPRTRDFIEWLNANFSTENRSDSSYDDVRRVDLDWIVLAGLSETRVLHADLSVVPRGEPSQNNPRRGHGLTPEVAEVIRAYGTPEYSSRLSAFMTGRKPLAELLMNPRRIEAMRVVFPGATGEIELAFGPGAHNKLIKACIEEFLPMWGHDAEVLYVGDADDRFLFRADERLKELQVYELEADELPDVVAYSSGKDWLYVIEAVHSVGPVSREKHLRYKSLFADCKPGIVYVTAFQSRDSFRRFAAEIAWETEVWLADEPTHLVHYNGDRFLGPHDEQGPE